MKVKTIAGKLALALALALAVLALAVGLSFSALFRDYSREEAKARLEGQARVILSLIDTGMKESMGRGAGRGQPQIRGSANYRRYLQALNTQADIDAWVVDRDGHLTTGYRQPSEELPDDFLPLFQAVMAGETRFLEGQASQQGLPTLTLGLPIQGGNGIDGALFLHTPLAALRQAEMAGLRTLAISVLIGLLLALAASLFMVRRFSRPLERVRATALALAEGDYSARCQVNQQDEVGELARAVDTLSLRLDEARQERENAEGLRREFMANVSHELKTPVAALRAMLETLRDGLVTTPDQVQGYYQSMLQETGALEALIRDQMELSRLQAPGFSLARETLDLRQAADDALGSARAMAEKKEVLITVSLPDAPVMLEGDHSRLRQMMLIVLDNALRFTPPGSSVSLRLVPGCLEIADSGPGIPEDSLNLVFDRFYRVPGGEKGPGSGLGLAIAREIAQRHDMTLTARNNTSGGAVFSFKWEESNG
ncbi:MAG: sensor histidine kinase [Christensenellales bacterium]|jgi:signal transduction histidine kinase